MQFIFAFILFIPLITLNAQDDLLKIDTSELYFHSPLEKELITSESSYNDINVLFAIDSTLTKDKLEKLMQDYKSSLNKARIRKGKEEKNLGQISDVIATNYIKFEISNSTLQETLEMGRYDLISIIYLYIIAFQKFNIPYHINGITNLKQPSVNLVAYPYEEMYILDFKNETMFSKVTEEAKSNYIQLLLNTGYINKEDLANKSNEEVFKTYFFGDGELKFKALASFSYVHKALIDYNNNEYVSFINNMEKAYFLNPTKQLQQELILSYLSAIDFLKNENFRKMKMLATLCNYSQEMESQKVEDAYIAAFNEVYTKKGDTAYMNKVYNYLINNIQKNELRDAIIYAHNLYVGMALADLGVSEEQVLEHWSKSLKIHPNNLHLQNEIAKSIIRMAVKEDRKAVPELLESYLEEYPFLTTHSKYLSAMTFYYCILGEENFKYNKISIGLTYVNKLENLIKPGDFTDQESWISSLYDAAAYSYVRKKMYSKALTMINKGLQYYPENKTLLDSKAFIKKLK